MNGVARILRLERTLQITLWILPLMQKPPDSSAFLMESHPHVLYLSTSYDWVPTF